MRWLKSVQRWAFTRSLIQRLTVGERRSRRLTLEDILLFFRMDLDAICDKRTSILRCSTILLQIQRHGHRAFSGLTILLRSLIWLWTFLCM